MSAIRTGSAKSARSLRLSGGVVLAAGALVLVAGCTGAKHAAPKVVHSTQTAPVPAPLTAARASVVADALTSGTPARIAAVLAPVVAAAYQASPTEMWPAGTTMTIDSSGFRRLGSDDGIATATTTGPVSASYTMLLIWSNGQWDVLSTALAQ